MRIPQLNPVKIFKNRLIHQIKIQNKKFNPSDPKGLTHYHLVKAFKGLGIHLSVVQAMDALVETKGSRDRDGVGLITPFGNIFNIM